MKSHARSTSALVFLCLVLNLHFAVCAPGSSASGLPITSPVDNEQLESFQSEQTHPVEGEYLASATGSDTGTFTFLLILTRDGSKWTGEARESRIPFTIKEVTVNEENHVIITATVGQAILTISGDYRADEISGGWKLGNSTGTWKATKKKKDAAQTGGAGSDSTPIPGQFATDFVAGTVPDDAQLSELEQELTRQPDNFQLIRKLGKGYVFQFFGDNRAESVPKAQRMLERALALKKDDAETMAYLGALNALVAQRLKQPNSDEQKAIFRDALGMLKKAESLDSDNGAVLAVVGASYLFFPDSFGTAPLALSAMERIRSRMGPAFARFSHHGQQRVLLTQGEAYARMGQMDKARVCFQDGLKVNSKSREADLIRSAMTKFKISF